MNEAISMGQTLPLFNSHSNRIKEGLMNSSLYNRTMPYRDKVVLHGHIIAYAESGIKSSSVCTTTLELNYYVMLLL